MKTALLADFKHTLPLLHTHSADAWGKIVNGTMVQVTTGRTFLRDCTVVSPMTLLLFGGELDVKHEEGLVFIDGWIRVRAAAPTAVLVKQLRLALDTLLQRTISSPEMDLSSQGAELVATLVKLLTDEEQARYLQL